MIDHNFRDESDESAIAFTEIDNWFEKLIEEEEAAEKLEGEGYTYQEALSLIKKYGLCDLKEKS